MKGPFHQWESCASETHSPKKRQECNMKKYHIITTIILMSLVSWAGGGHSKGRQALCAQRPSNNRHHQCAGRLYPVAHPRQLDACQSRWRRHEHSRISCGLHAAGNHRVLPKETPVSRRGCIGQRTPPCGNHVHDHRSGSGTCHDHQRLLCLGARYQRPVQKLTVVGRWLGMVIFQRR